MTPSITQRDRLADVRARAKELRDRRNRAREFHGAARQAANEYAGDGPIEHSDEFLRLERASRDLDEIGHALELVEAEEKYVLSAMAGVDGPIGEGSFLHDQNVLEQLRHAAYSESRLGRMDLGYAVTRDEYLAELDRTSIYAAAGDVSVPANARTTYYGLGPDQLARRLNLLDLVPKQRMDTGSFDYTPISGNLDTAAEVVDAAVKAAADIVLGDATAKAQTIAHFLKIPKPQLADVPGLQAQLERRLIYGVNRRIEQAMINGNGSDPNLLGILNTSGIGAPASGVGDTVNADLVLSARTSVNTTGAVANGIVMHPTDIQKALKAKASGSGERLDSEGAFSAVPTQMWGLPLVEVPVPALAGKALVGDFSQCTLFVREGVHVLASDSDQDDFIRNRVSLLGEARVAVAWWQPAAFAVTNLTFPA